MNKIIIDLDGTISFSQQGKYEEAVADLAVVEKLYEYKALGFEIAIHTSRNMRTYESCLGKINKFTLPNIVMWLNRHNVPFDEIYVGKPWCGKDGFYVDDRSIRPSELKDLSYADILKVISR